MDLSQLDTRAGAERGATLHLKMPDADEFLYRNGKPMEIDLLGLESSVGRRRIAELAKKHGRQNKRNISKMSIDEIMRTFEENNGDKAELFSLLTTGWREIADAGKEIKFSKENALKIYNKFLWIQDQIDEFQADRTHFLDLSATVS